MDVLRGDIAATITSILQLDGDMSLLDAQSLYSTTPLLERNAISRWTSSLLRAGVVWQGELRKEHAFLKCDPVGASVLSTLLDQRITECPDIFWALACQSTSTVNWMYLLELIHQFNAEIDALSKIDDEKFGPRWNPVLKCWVQVGRVFACDFWSLFNQGHGQVAITREQWHVELTQLKNNLLQYMDLVIEEEKNMMSEWTE